MKITGNDLELEKQYWHKVNIGKEIAKDKKIVFCGLARNCGTKINRNIGLIKEFCSHFRDSAYFVLENNSTDSTKQILQQNNYKNIGTDDSQSFSGGFAKDRIVRLADYRSRIQKYIGDKHGDFDYVVVFDYDVVDWNPEGIFTSLAWGDFDMMGSYSQVYHPSLNSNDGWVNHDRWAFKFHSWKEEFSTNQNSDITWFWFWKPPAGARPIRCLSVFGGLGIYTMQAYLAGTYGYKHPFQPENEITSEHNEFHRTLHEAGYDKIYLNPSQRCIIG